MKGEAAAAYPCTVKFRCQGCRTLRELTARGSGDASIICRVTGSSMPAISDPTICVQYRHRTTRCPSSKPEPHKLCYPDYMPFPSLLSSWQIRICAALWADTMSNTGPSSPGFFSNTLETNNSLITSYWVCVTVQRSHRISEERFVSGKVVRMACGGAGSPQVWTEVRQARKLSSRNRWWRLEKTWSLGRPRRRLELRKVYTQ